MYILYDIRARKKHDMHALKTFYMFCDRFLCGNKDTLVQKVTLEVVKKR